ncbi:hypothetical protein HDU84_003988 [Entophlyctis sp. JEL0112]|nr:hypothetical protein HDU84_003988 [Entophlyctis sp. JEL0112]
MSETPIQVTALPLPADAAGRSPTEGDAHSDWRKSKTGSPNTKSNTVSTIEKTLELLRAGATVFYKNGKEMWSRESQTTELISLDLSMIDKISQDIRQDMEVCQKIFEVTSGAKLQESQVLLYSIISRKLKELRQKYAQDLKRAKAEQAQLLITRINEARAVFEVQNRSIIAEIEAKHAREITVKQAVLAQVKNSFNEQNQEYHTLKYKVAKIYLSLKTKNIPEIGESNETADAQKQQMVSMVDELRDSIARCDDEIRLLRPKLFQLEEEADRVAQSRRKNIVGVVSTGDSSANHKYVKISGDSSDLNDFMSSSYAADPQTRELVASKVKEEFEAYLAASIHSIKSQLSEAEDLSKRTIREWEIKFRAVEAMLDSKQFTKIFNKQQKILNLATKVILAQKKCTAVDFSQYCQLFGHNLKDLRNMEIVSFKRKFLPVLKQLVSAHAEREAKRRKRQADVAGNMKNRKDRNPSNEVKDNSHLRTGLSNLSTANINVRSRQNSNVELSRSFTGVSEDSRFLIPTESEHRGRSRSPSIIDNRVQQELSRSRSVSAQITDFVTVNSNNRQRNHSNFSNEGDNSVLIQDFSCHPKEKALENSYLFNSHTSVNFGLHSAANSNIDLNTNFVFNSSFVNVDPNNLSSSGPHLNLDHPETFVYDLSNFHNAEYDCNRRMFIPDMKLFSFDEAYHVAHRTNAISHHHFDAYPHDFTIEELQLLRPVKKSVFKGLFGVDVKKPKHLPPLHMEIEGTFMVPTQVDAAGHRSRIYLSNEEAQKRKCMVRLRHLQTCLQREKQKQVQDLNKKQEKEKATSVLDKFNIRPWSVSSSMKHPSKSMNDENSIDIDTESSLNDVTMYGVYGVSLLQGKMHSNLRKIPHEHVDPNSVFRWKNQAVKIESMASLIVPSGVRGRNFGAGK